MVNQYVFYGAIYVYNYIYSDMTFTYWHKLIVFKLKNVECRYGEFCAGCYKDKWAKPVLNIMDRLFNVLFPGMTAAPNVFYAESFVRVN